MLELLTMLVVVCVQMPNAIPYLQERLAKLQRFQRNLRTIQNLHVLEMYRELQSIYKLNVLELPRTFWNWAKLALLALCWLSSLKLWAIGLVSWAVRNTLLQNTVFTNSHNSQYKELSHSTIKSIPLRINYSKIFLDTCQNILLKFMVQFSCLVSPRILQP